MVEAASLGLAESLTQAEHDDDLLYPRIERIRDISGEIAAAVIRAAQKDGVDRNVNIRQMDDAALKSWIHSKMWNAAV
jgi:malate dehydrogenase (oxaloacetate-decarboxylating)(NADP+)